MADIIAFTPYLCTESKFHEITSKQNGDFFYCYDSGNAYTMVDNIAKPLRACKSEALTISPSSTRITKTFDDDLDNILFVIMLDNATQTKTAADANISVTSDPSLRTLTIEAANTPANNIDITLLSFFNYPTN